MNMRQAEEEEWREAFLSLERQGLSAPQIAERMNVSSRTIQRWRTRLGVNHRPPTERIPRERREEARQMLDDGCSFSEVAESIGVHWSTVRHWFPDMSGWTRSQAGAHAQDIRRFNKVA